MLRSNEATTESTRVCRITGSGKAGPIGCFTDGAEALASFGLLTAATIQSRNAAYSVPLAFYVTSGLFGLDI